MRTATQTRSTRSSTPGFLQSLNAEIQERQKELQTLEAARALIVGQEPAPRRGRPKRRFQANATENTKATGTVKRGPGRPRGSKNKPKVGVSKVKVANDESFANDPQGSTAGE